MTVFPRLAAVLLPFAAACAPAEPSRVAMAPAPSVTARGETDAVGTANADAADDPAIWRDAANPSASLIIGTDKKAGLYVYGLDGKTRSFLDAGQVNNVDLRDGVMIGGKPGILVVASDRTDRARSAVAVFRLDPASATLTALGKIATAPGEAYGICLYRKDADVWTFIILKDGTIEQVALDLADGAAKGRVVRRMKLGTQSEGCVADDRTGRLYVAEEDIGIWRFDADPAGPTAPIAIAGTDTAKLIADAEGLALAIDGPTGGYLVASSQGDNAYALYRLEDDSYVGRFRIANGAIDGTYDTDGIEVVLGNFGPDYPGGLMVAQDGNNAPHAQNFKLVAWADVLKTLGLE